MDELFLLRVWSSDDNIVIPIGIFSSQNEVQKFIENPDVKKFCMECGFKHWEVDKHTVNPVFSESLFYNTL
jgi:hypothetical protein